MIKFYWWILVILLLVTIYLIRLCKKNHNHKSKCEKYLCFLEDTCYLLTYSQVTYQDMYTHNLFPLLKGNIYPWRKYYHVCLLDERGIDYLFTQPQVGYQILALIKTFSNYVEFTQNLDYNQLEFPFDRISPETFSQWKMLNTI